MQFLLDNPVAMQNKYRQMLKTNQRIPDTTKKQLRQAVLAGEEKALDILVQMFDWLDGLKPQPTTDIMSLYDQSQEIETEIANTLAIMRQAAKTDKELDKVQRQLDGAKVVSLLVTTAHVLCKSLISVCTGYEDVRKIRGCSQSERLVPEVDRPTQHRLLRP